jgi:hypothetical protein
MMEEQQHEGNSKQNTMKGTRHHEAHRQEQESGAGETFGVLTHEQR